VELNLQRLRREKGLSQEELADLAGMHHAGGGSHGSLVAGDSFVPVVTVGLKAELHRITDVAPAVLAHFGVAVPDSMEALAGVR